MAELIFQKSQITVKDESHASILEIGEKNGVSLKSLCRKGLCGTCKIRKLEGNVQMKNPFALLEGEQEAGWILTCIGRAKGKVILDS